MKFFKSGQTFQEILFGQFFYPCVPNGLEILYFINWALDWQQT